MNSLDADLLKSFLRYSDLASPAPLSIAEVQALLDEDESLLFKERQKAMSGYDAGQEASRRERRRFLEVLIAGEYATSREKELR